MVILAHSKAGAENVSVKTKKGNTWQYLCFSGDFSDRFRWEKSLCANIQKIEIKDGFPAVIDRMRAPFLNYIRQVDNDLNPEVRWLSPITEQNTYVSKLFVDCCRLEYIREILVGGAQERDFIIIADDYSFLRSARKICTEKGMESTIIGLHPILRDIAGLVFIPLYHTASFLIRSLVHKYAAYTTRRYNKTLDRDKHEAIILHTWVDETCFGKDGVFRDRYFGRLIEWIEDKGHRLYIVPLLHNVKRSVKDSYKWLRKEKHNFLIPYDYYKASDYLKACRIMAALLLTPCKGLIFLENNITDIVRREVLHNAGSSFVSSLYLSLPKRLHRRGYRFKAAIDVFEGMTPEKAWLMGIKKAFPNAFTIGYQHTVFSKNLLCYFVHGRHLPGSVLPDGIICTGPLIKRFLAEQGLPEERLIIGCALRYEYLSSNNIPLAAKGERESKKRLGILVALPLQPDGALEVISKLSNTVTNRRDMSFFVKPHPMMKQSFVSEAIEKAKWSDNFEIVEGSMDKWLSNSAVLISSASATTLEAIIAGIPVVIVGSGCTLDLNPLDWFDMEYARPFINEEDIKNRLDELLAMNDKELENLKELGKNILGQCFAPVSDESLKVFLPA